MDDDIDIEEHDLLDNPEIRKIFPDINSLKAEIRGLYEETNVKQELNEYVNTEVESEDLKVFTENDDANPDIVFDEKSKSPLCYNKIILGSKPVCQNQYEIEVDTEEIIENIYSSRVYLVDIGAYLKKSERYCSTCLIHFPRKDALKNHINEVHIKKRVDEIPLSSSNMKNKEIYNPFQGPYKCTKCPQEFQRHSFLMKHYRAIHKRKRRPPIFKGGAKNKCFHCSEVFYSEELLIDHIYMVLSNKNTRNGTPSRNFIRDSIIQIRQKNNKTRRELGSIMKRTTNESKKQEAGSRKEIKSYRRQTSSTMNRDLKAMLISPPTLKLFRCLYCSYYFSDNTFCLKHIQKKHRDFSAVKLKVVSFDGKCVNCSCICGNWKSYNVHMLHVHKDKVNMIFMNPKLVIPRVEIAFTKTSNLCNNMTDNLTKTKKPLNFNEKLSDKPSNRSHTTAELFDPEESDVEVDDDPDYFNSAAENADGDCSEKVMILKPVLFKCKRCDIHFLSAKSTVNHEDHMELLINWKCAICKKIFKKQDEIAHHKQHLNTDQFSVIELETSELERIFYKCPKCAIHFQEDKYFSHFETCENIVAGSCYCKICDFLIDKFAYSCHTSGHELHHLKPADFTVIVSDVIRINSTKDTRTDETINSNKDIDNSIDIKIETHSIHTDLPQIRKHNTLHKTSDIKRPFRPPNSSGTNFKMIYCAHCKCFLRMALFKENLHKKSRCAHLNPRICKECGLVVTHHMIKSHKQLHVRKKNLKLQHFTFYDITGKQIVPPVPEYPKCQECDVHLISKSDLLEHRCDENNEFLTCYICDMKLSESVFKLHMSFHYYSKTCDNSFRSIILNDEDEKSYNSKSIEMDGVSKDTPCLKSRKRRSRVQSPQGHVRESKPVTSYNNVLDSKKYKSEQDTVTKPIVKADIDKPIEQTKHAVNSDMKSDYELFNILYCCASCNTTIDTYDKVVEHCQNHVCGASIETETCTICEMTMERKSYNDHCKLHNVNVSQEPFELLTFDMFYFILSNERWLEHVFEPINEEKRLLILSRSIYRKSKIRMKIIQIGSPELTMYQCNNCSNVVEPETISKHAETSCFKMRKYLCSSCGLAFLSYLALQEHETIHTTEKSITLKSYRIVSFNESKYKRDNKILTVTNSFFHLYKCRNCGAVIDKYQRAQHKCNNDNLKKCKLCDLMIPSLDYRAHCIKHQNVINFVQRNMKVILFGQKDLSSDFVPDVGGLECFDGTFVDYTFYRCVGCGVCFDKKEIEKLNHNLCHKDISMVKCSKCDLLIAKSRMTLHIRLHELNTDFEKENINVIPYIANEFQANYVPADDCNSQSVKELMEINSDLYDSDSTSSAKTVVLENETNETTKRTVKLYKCTCELHFLTSSSIQMHFGSCNSRNLRQKCSKCSLLFTPSVLFEHLLKHHGDKKYDYDFNIIEMSPMKCNVVTIYNCVNCETHFVDYENARAHYRVCHISINNDLWQRKKCNKCNLYFYDSSIKLHASQHKYDVADMNIVDINDDEENDHENDEDSSDSDNMTLEDDFVIDSNIHNHNYLKELSLK